MNLAVRIQHNQGKRDRWANLLFRVLMPEIDPLADDVKVLGGDTLWQSCINVLSSYEKKHTHVLVLQDDVLPCVDFIPAVKRIIEAYPDRAITYFSTREAIDEAIVKNLNYVEQKYFFMAQCYSMPVAMIKDFLQFNYLSVKDSVKMDDERIGTYLFMRGLKAIATAPSLVEHLGWNGTTLDYKYKKSTFDPRLRMARQYIGFEQSALNIDWSIKDTIIDNEGDYSMFNSNLK